MHLYRQNASFTAGARDHSLPLKRKEHLKRLLVNKVLRDMPDRASHKSPELVTQAEREITLALNEKQPISAGYLTKLSKKLQSSLARRTADDRPKKHGMSYDESREPQQKPGVHLPSIA